MTTLQQQFDQHRFYNDYRAEVHGVEEKIGVRCGSQRAVMRESASNDNPRRAALMGDTEIKKE